MTSRGCERDFLILIALLSLCYYFSEYLFLWLLLRGSREHEVYLGREDCLDKR